MEEEIIQKLYAAREALKQNFSSDEAQAKREEHLDNIRKEFEQWKSRTNAQMQDVIDEKYDEVCRVSDDYQQEVGDKYTQLVEKLKNYSSLSELNGEIESFRRCCQTQTIEKHLRPNVKTFTEDELAGKLQYTYVPFSDVQQEIAVVPLRPVMRSKKGTGYSNRSSFIPSSVYTEIDIEFLPDSSEPNANNKKRISQLTIDFSEEGPSIPLYKPTQISTPSNIARQPKTNGHLSATTPSKNHPGDITPVRDNQKPDLSKNKPHLNLPIENLEVEPFTPLRKSTTTSTPTKFKSRLISESDSDGISTIATQSKHDPGNIKPVRDGPKSNGHSSKQVSRSSSEEIVIPSRKPPTTSTPMKLKPQPRSESGSDGNSMITVPSEPEPGNIKPVRVDPKSDGHSSKQVSRSSSEEIVTPSRKPPTTSTPMKLKAQPRSESGSDGNSATTAPSEPEPENIKPGRDSPKSDVPRGKQVSRSPSEETVISSRKSTTTTNKSEVKGPTRLYVNKDHVLTPILVDKNREHSNEKENSIEYSIDSIALPRNKDQQQKPSHINTDNDDRKKLVHAYKVLVKPESDNERNSRSSSQHDDEEEINDDHIFDLRKLNQTNFTTIMFQECETQSNCIASSTKRNELIIYNSKLKVLVILQHEDHQQCRNRLYLQWHEGLSSEISDIIYYQNNDQFLIATKNSHIYVFDRNLLSISDLGRLDKDSKTSLHRIHCSGQSVYCILGDNHLLEFQLDEHCSSLKFIRKINLFNPKNHSQDTTYRLLDVTCDKTNLIVIYASENDTIHLQSINRESIKFHQDLKLDEEQPIQVNDIRIESTMSDGNFIYLNSSKKHLKSIDFRKYENGKITSQVRRKAKPTNVCFLHDGRFVILYENPYYYLSVHNSNNR